MRHRLGAFLALLCSFGASVCGAADDTGAQGGGYFGLFGGFGTAASTGARQQGGFYLPAPLSARVNVDANGKTSTEALGLLGVQAGYEWQRLALGASDWAVKPAVELEGLYLGEHSPVGDMPITPSALGTQVVSLPTTVGVLLANVVVTVRTPYSSRIVPYLGAGAGLARVSIRGANSANPSEPGVNHFDSWADASAYAFAMQLKAGVKAEVVRNLSVFAEYRYLSINSTGYTFGATLPPHFPTDTWQVSLGPQAYTLFVAGLQVRF
jgi:opacity protein-like surface antigen